MKILNIIKRRKEANEGYIILNDKNTVKKEVCCEKPNISELINKLSGMLNKTIRYEDLTEENVNVLLCGEIKIDTENRTIKLETINKENALLALANIS